MGASVAEASPHVPKPYSQSQLDSPKPAAAAAERRLSMHRVEAELAAARWAAWIVPIPEEQTCQPSNRTPTAPLDVEGAVVEAILRCSDERVAGTGHDRCSPACLPWRSEPNTHRHQRRKLESTSQERRAFAKILRALRRTPRPTRAYLENSEADAPVDTSTLPILH